MRRSEVLLGLSMLILVGCSSVQSTNTGLPTPSVDQSPAGILLPTEEHTQTPIADITPAEVSVATPLPPGFPSPTPITAGISLWDTSQAEPAHELFILTLLPDHSFYQYRAFLYNLDTGEAKSKDIDLTETGWHLMVAGGDCGCDLRGQPAQYNPVTGEFYFAVVRGPIGIADEKPPGSLPDAPFSFAIYKTDFDPQSRLSLLFRGPDPGLLSFGLNLKMNRLVIEEQDGPSGEPLRPLINQLDLTDGSISYLAQLYGEKDGRLLERVSNIGISPQGDKLYQAFLYENPYDPSDTYAEIVVINLLDRHRETRAIADGDRFPYDVSRFSSADLSRGVSIPFTPPASVDEPIAWSATGRYAAFRRENQYLIFDASESSVFYSGIENGYAIFAAEWR